MPLILRKTLFFVGIFFMIFYLFFFILFSFPLFADETLVRIDNEGFVYSAEPSSNSIKSWEGSYSFVKNGVTTQVQIELYKLPGLLSFSTFSTNPTENGEKYHVGIRVGEKVFIAAGSLSETNLIVHVPENDTSTLHAMTVGNDDQLYVVELAFNTTSKTLKDVRIYDNFDFSVLYGSGAYIGLVRPILKDLKSTERYYFDIDDTITIERLGGSKPVIHFLEYAGIFGKYSAHTKERYSDSKICYSKIHHSINLRAEGSKLKLTSMHAAFSAETKNTRLFRDSNGKYYAAAAGVIELIGLAAFSLDDRKANRVPAFLLIEIQNNKIVEMDIRSVYRTDLNNMVYTGNTLSADYFPMNTIFDFKDISKK